MTERKRGLFMKHCIDVSEYIVPLVIRLVVKQVYVKSK